MSLTSCGEFHTTIHLQEMNIKFNITIGTTLNKYIYIYLMKGMYKIRKELICFIRKEKVCVVDKIL